LPLFGKVLAKGDVILVCPLVKFRVKPLHWAAPVRCYLRNILLAQAVYVHYIYYGFISE
jgi:hypothetical protein